MAQPVRPTTIDMNDVVAELTALYLHTPPFEETP